MLVTGGRGYADADTVARELAAAGAIGLLVHGAARGADALADAWARRRGVPVQQMPAQWREHGRAAGPMLDRWHPSLLVAFPGGRGTADMVRRARRAGVPVREVLLG